MLRGDFPQEAHLVALDGGHMALKVGERSSHFPPNFAETSSNCRFVTLVLMILLCMTTPRCSRARSTGTSWTRRLAGLAFFMLIGFVYIFA